MFLRVLGNVALVSHSVSYRKACSLTRDCGLPELIVKFKLMICYDFFHATLMKQDLCKRVAELSAFCKQIFSCEGIIAIRNEYDVTARRGA